ncbi:MAG: YkgJ family cysteine cluster protein [Acidobacteria bacterium]|nr:YkgJ family cysteine cluster protein [Acidobacteriota bacterium]
MSDSYREILRRADDHFDLVRKRLGQHLECRLGCTGCCHGLFEIGAADVAMITDALRAAAPSLRDRIVARSREILETFDSPAIRDCSSSEKEEFFERAGDVACPALADDGACMFYDHRPLVCRTFGLPIREGSSYLGQECELNFVAALREEKESAAWDLEWEDAVGPEDQFTIPEAVVLASLFID